MQGTQLVNELIDIYGLDVVQAYMAHIQSNAEMAVREMLTTVGQKLINKTGSNVVTARDYLDDGSVIQLRLEFDVTRGEAICDFVYVVLIFFSINLSVVFDNYHCTN